MILAQVNVSNAYTIIMMTIPGILVLIMAYMLLHGYFSNEKKIRELDILLKNNSETLPIRFQAYERLLLLLERLSPFKILSRFSPEGLTAPEYQLIMIQSIRQELEHNVTQQLYVSDDSWQVVRSVVEESISIMNGLAEQLPSEATGRDLQRALIAYYQQEGVTIPTEKGVAHLRTEAKTYLG